MTPHFAPGAPAWADISVPDIERARTFYSAVNGWTIPPGEDAFGGYTTASSGENGVAGLMPAMEGVPTAWCLYFASDDADATAAAILANGGELMMPVTQVADFGRMLVAMDPSGGAFGVWEADQMVGFEAPGTPGSFCWCDLRSTDPDAARAFYSAVFGWSYQALEMAGPAYTTFTIAGAVDGAMPSGGVGDMMGAPDGVPSHWLVYFAVADADASAAAAAANGGTLLAPAFGSPFGRMQPLLDPFGAALWLVQLPSA